MIFIHRRMAATNRAFDCIMTICQWNAKVDVVSSSRCFTFLFEWSKTCVSYSRSREKIQLIQNVRTLRWYTVGSDRPIGDANNLQISWMNGIHFTFLCSTMSRKIRNRASYEKNDGANYINRPTATTSTGHTESNELCILWFRISHFESVSTLLDLSTHSLSTERQTDKSETNSFDGKLHAIAPGRERMPRKVFCRFFKHKNGKNRLDNRNDWKWLHCREKKVVENWKFPFATAK